MVFWIYFTIFWTIGYIVAYTVIRPEVLFRRKRNGELFDFGMPRWNEDSTAHLRLHYKAYVPVFIALWIVLFLMAVHLKDTLG